jgi:hypothetical protein
MKKFLTAAARRRVSGELIEQVERAFEGFEQFAERNAGDREGLEAMLGVCLPEERQKYELASKEAIFKGFSQLRGIAKDTAVVARFRRPSESDPATLDSAVLVGDFGIYRSHPETGLGFTHSLLLPPSHMPAQFCTLSGQASTDVNDYLLPEFCSVPTPQFKFARVVANEITYDFTIKDIGLRATVDVVLARYSKALHSRYRTQDNPATESIAAQIEEPIKRLVQDVFLHKDVYPGSKPRLAVHDTIARGLVNIFDDPSRQQDRFRAHESIMPIPGGVQHAKLRGVPRYGEMIEHVCAKLGWNPEDFRGYRLEVQYPILGAQYSIGFDLPEKEGSG